MATKYVVDTHALVWYVEGSQRLGANAKAVLDDPNSELILPVIALAEACWMIERGRTRISDIPKFIAALDSGARIVITPLDRRAVERSTALTAIREMHDRQIVATSLAIADLGEPVAMLTKDDNIRQSGLVDVIW